MKRRFLYKYGSITAGALLLALGTDVFMLPNKLSSGGVTSVGTVLLYTLGIKMSVTNITVNMLLFFFGYKYLGKDAVIKTILGIMFLSVFLEIFSDFAYSADSLFTAAVCGGILIGSGIGLVVRAGASTGGSDFLSLIVKRFFPYISVSFIILMTDSIIIVIAGIIFKSFEITFYSLVALTVSCKFTDLVLTFGNKAKAVKIFSEKNEKIASEVMLKLGRGVSSLYCRGMYTKKEGVMLFCIVTPKELPFLIGIVKQNDASAFITVSDVTEVMGEGFLR